MLDGNREGEDCTYTNPKNTIDISVGGHHDGAFGSDFEYVANSGDLDECNGITVDGEYRYIVTNEFPYVSRCLMGEVAQEERRGKRPSLNDSFQKMDTNSDGKLSKEEVKGPLSNEFSKIDTNSDGFLSKEELKNAPKPSRGGNRR